MKAKKFLAILLAAAMLLSLGISAFATNSDGESYTRGSITIKNPQTKETYSAYKIFDVTYDGTKYAYTIAPEWVDDVVAYATPSGTTLADGWTTTTANGLTVTKAMNTSGVTAYVVTYDAATFSAADFGEKMAAKTSGKTATALTVPDGGTKPKASNLDLGYYMVQPTTANALVSLTTTDADVQVSDKNEKPEVDKKIADEEDIVTCTTAHEHTAECPTKEKDYTTRSVGDNVPFELDTKVPDMTGYQKYFFVVNDTMSKGLTFNGDVVVKINGTAIGTDAYTVKTVTNNDGSTNIRIVFKDMLQYQSQNGTPIVITYSATVNQAAVTGTDGNTNTAKVEYSNNPNIKPEYEEGTPPTDPNDPQDPNYNHNKPGSGVKDPTGESAEDKVTVYTTELDLTKVDANGGAALAGAKFKIEGDKLNVSIVNKEIFERDDTNGTWYRLKDGTYTQESPAEQGKSTDTTYEEVAVAEPVTYTELTGAQAVANEGLYYSTDGGTTKTLITAENIDKVPTGAKIYQPTYNTVGLFIKNGDNYVQITEANAASYLNGPFYKAINWTQSDLYEDITQKYKKVEVVDKNTSSEKITAEGFVDDETGVITFGKLAEGPYKITELIAPDGYNLLKNPIEVKIELVEGDTAEHYKFQATVDGAETAISESAGVISFDVENNQGIELPETGGIGTTIFYVLGGLFVIGAGILLITKKRMGTEA